MTGPLDSQTIEFPCPNCRQKCTETIGKLKLNPKLTCRACHKDFTVDANQLRTGIQGIEKALTELKRTLSRFGK